MTQKIANLPDEDHVMRYVGWNQLRKDDKENVIGFLPNAFELRPVDEGAISVNWLEYFGGDKSANIKMSVQTFRSTRKVGSKSAFGIGNVGKIKQTASSMGTKIRVVHDPEPNNPSHSTILRLSQDDFALLDALASDAFTEFVLNASLP